MEIYEFLVGDFTHLIWQGVILPCVLVGGIWFTYCTRGMHVVHFGRVMKEILGTLRTKKEPGESGITPFQALCTALAGTVGTGSVVGTCQALALGGPGALFWLWVASFFGMIIKFAEVTLAIRFRRRDENGEWLGGPMYYILDGMGKRFKPIAVLYAVFSLLASFGMGCLAQANSVTAGVKSIAESAGTLSEDREEMIALGVAVFLGISLLLALFGGARRVGKVAEILVPVMSLLFVLVCGTVLFVLHSRLPEVFATVLQAAFGSRALCGALSGIGMKTALEWGLKRSAFSNEAGLGSAAIAHASAETRDPVRQGFFGIFEVFVDTLVICSLTGLTVLVALPVGEILASPAADASLVVRAVGMVFGNTFSSVFVGSSLALFAFSTLLGWSLYGARSARFLFGTASVRVYRVLFALLAALGACLAMEPIWALSDLFNGLMAIPNFLALFALSGTVRQLTLDFFKKTKGKIQKDLTQARLCDRI